MDCLGNIWINTLHKGDNDEDDDDNNNNNNKDNNNNNLDFLTPAYRVVENIL
jgi:hypothetical protein